MLELVVYVTRQYERNMNTKKRADIDFLKTIAIIAVILYHFFDIQKASSKNFNFSLFDGGFLGVDIFLVVSGFLITGSIVSKLYSSEFSILEFYKRRLSRIYPPLITLCLFVAFFGYFLLLPDLYKEAVVETVNALIGIANFRFANSGGYFSLATVDKALLHTWYIALTIQFYILIPIILVTFKTLFKNKFRYAVLILTISLICIAPKFCVEGKGYLLTQCRIWEMFVGASLFLFKDDLNSFLVRENRKISAFYFYAGIIATIVSILTVRLNYGEYYVHTSAFTVVATCIVLFSNYQNSFILNRYTTLLGKTSYSLYLWHWPVFVFAFQCNTGLSVMSVGVIALILIATTFCSYKTLETKKVSAIFSLLCVLLIAACYVYVKKADGTNYLQNYMIETQKSSFTEKHKNTDSIYFSKNNFSIDKIVASNEEEPKRFIIGDSHTGQYKSFYLNDYNNSIYFSSIAATMAFGEISANYKTVLPPPLNIYPVNRVTFFEFYKKMLDTLIPGSKVILACNWHVHYEIFIRENNLKKDTENYKKYIEAVVADLDSQIKKHNDLKFYIIGQGAYISRKDLQCTKLDLKDSFLRHVISQGNCKTFTDDIEDKTLMMNSALKKYADIHSNVTFIDRNIPLRQENNQILGYDDNHYPIYNDDHHYTFVGSKIVAKYIMNIVDEE